MLDIGVTGDSAIKRAEIDARILPYARSDGREGVFGDDREWVIVMAIATALECTWWIVTWASGFAPTPFLLTYLLLAFGGLACALVLRAIFRPHAVSPDWPSTILATALIGIGASLFLPLKYAIPQLVPFWVDVPLVGLERTLFTSDPWLLLDNTLGWAAIPIDRLYGLWLPTQSLVLFTLVVQPSSAAKSRALITYVLAWLLLGVVAATIFSSAGPIFHDRIFGGTSFAALRDTLEHREAWIALAESDRMWLSFAKGRPGFVAGISAVPSIHVAISLWLFLVARTMAPRAGPIAFFYFVLIWIGSVQLGWHYAVDGLAGVVGIIAIWALAGWAPRLRPETSSRLT